ncbi:MAG: hypothetical protein Q7R95_09720 [bacterium]|nr:hypothetical protein [bacterium]
MSINHDYLMYINQFGLKNLELVPISAEELWCLIGWDEDRKKNTALRYFDSKEDAIIFCPDCPIANGDLNDGNYGVREIDV